MTNIYRLALQVQDASNINGVTKSLAEVVMPGIRSEPEYEQQGTAYVATHPALLLFLDKMVSLTRKGWISDMDGAISEAYRICEDRAKALEATVDVEMGR